MQIQSVTSPAYADASNTTIIAQVKFDAFATPIPYHAGAHDTEALGLQLYNDLVAGKYGAVAPWAVNVQVASNTGLYLAGQVTQAIASQVQPSGAGFAAAYQGGLMLASIAGAAPSAAPMSTTFASYASVYGLTPDAFAAFVLTTSASTAALNSALSTFSAAARAATTTAQLSTAIAAFNAALAAANTALSPVFVSPLAAYAAPAPISVSGI